MNISFDSINTEERQRVNFRKRATRYPSIRIDTKSNFENEQNPVSLVKFAIGNKHFFEDIDYYADDESNNLQKTSSNTSKSKSNSSYQRGLKRPASNESLEQEQVLPKTKFDLKYHGPDPFLSNGICISPARTIISKERITQGKEVLDESTPIFSKRKISVEVFNKLNQSNSDPNNKVVDILEYSTENATERKINYTSYKKVKVNRDSMNFLKDFNNNGSCPGIKENFSLNNSSDLGTSLLPQQFPKSQLISTTSSNTKLVDAKNYQPFQDYYAANIRLLEKQSLNDSIELTKSNISKRTHLESPPCLNRQPKSFSPSTFTLSPYRSRYKKLKNGKNSVRQKYRTIRSNKCTIGHSRKKSRSPSQLDFESSYKTSSLGSEKSVKYSSPLITSKQNTKATISQKSNGSLASTFEGLKNLFKQNSHTNQDVWGDKEDYNNKGDSHDNKIILNNRANTAKVPVIIIENSTRPAIKSVKSLRREFWNSIKGTFYGGSKQEVASAPKIEQPHQTEVQKQSNGSPIFIFKLEKNFKTLAVSGGDDSYETLGNCSQDIDSSKDDTFEIYHRRAKKAEKRANLDHQKDASYVLESGISQTVKHRHTKRILDFLKKT